MKKTILISFITSVVTFIVFGAVICTLHGFHKGHKNHRVHFMEMYNDSSMAGCTETHMDGEHIKIIKKVWNDSSMTGCCAKGDHDMEGLNGHAHHKKSDASCKNGESVCGLPLGKCKEKRTEFESKLSAEEKTEIARIKEILSKVDHSTMSYDSIASQFENELASLSTIISKHQAEIDEIFEAGKKVREDMMKKHFLLMSH